MLERTAAMLLLACCANAESASDKSWKNLRNTIKESGYTIVMRDGRCITGHIETFDENTVTVDSSKLDRKDVVRIGDSAADHDPIYSGRSSWADLQNSEPNKYERIELEIKNRPPRTCRDFSATDQEVTCDGSTIEKAQVARGYYVRLAPATAWEHYAMRENVPFLAPRTWFDLALFPRIKVLVYDDSLPQETGEVTCRIP